ncbi:MAG: hypothetical protein ABI876_13395 [Bacteroidota bacterium]
MNDIAHTTVFAGATMRRQTLTVNVVFSSAAENNRDRFETLNVGRRCYTHRCEQPSPFSIFSTLHIEQFTDPPTLYHPDNIEIVSDPAFCG